MEGVLFSCLFVFLLFCCLCVVVDDPNIFDTVLLALRPLIMHGLLAGLQGLKNQGATRLVVDVVSPLRVVLFAFVS